MNIGSIIDRIDNFKIKFSVNENHPQKIKSDENGMDSPDPEKDDILHSLNMLNSSLENINEKLKFTFHEKNKRVIIKVVNTETEEVVREIPPKEIVKLSEHLQKYIGMLVDESR